ncbi:MAG: nucleotidyltransferase family protein [Actinomycetota bacterium]|nr:nucleotidyltransferase family protein [Rubrobacter sp.]MDQ5814351.1 nucleotidyltransferase family protein [Actinomycetota bacterium]
MSGVSAVLLAAGSGSRFGGGKLLAPYKGRPLIEAALSGLRGSLVDEIIVVVGAEGERLRDVAAEHGARVVENPDWEEGMSTSVRAGLRACSPEARAALVSLADQPLVGTRAVERLVKAFKGGAEVVVATYGGEPRNPVLFAREVWPILERELSGDKGARVFLRRHPGLVMKVPCDDVADPADVDTVEDLRRLEDLSVPGRAPGERRSR